MSKKSALNVKTLILCALIIVGLVLAIVGLFGNIQKTEFPVVGTTYSKLADLSDLNDLAKKVDSTYEGYAVTNLFAWVTFVLAIVVAVCFVVAKFLGVKGLDTIVALIGCLTVAAAILVFVFAIIMANKHDVSIASGPILMLIGGLLSGGAAAASAKI